MARDVVMVGAGYAGVAFANGFTVDPETRLTWIAAEPDHLVKHEVHRAIRSPAVTDHLTIPLESIADDDVDLRIDRAVRIDTDRATVDLENGRPVEFDVLILAIGARTAFFGIPGLRENAVTLEGPSDARVIHERVTDSESSHPVRIVVGGGGLTGIQIAGEIDALARERDRSVDVTVVEALDEILPTTDAGLRRRVEAHLDRRGIVRRTGSPIVEATDTDVIFDDGTHLEFDLLVWTGGITGRELVTDGPFELDRNRVATDACLRTSEPFVYALGDTAAISQPGGLAPATAQAAWQAAPVAAANVRAELDGGLPTEWAYTDKGTVVSVGDSAVAQGITGVPIATFGSPPAATLKKAIAARWIAEASSWRRAIRAWNVL